MLPVKSNNKGRLAKSISLATLIILLVLVPSIVGQDPYILHIFIMLGINIILTLSLWLVLTTGQFTLGHAGFMAIGAYASVLLVMRAGLSFWLALPIAGVMSAIIAVMVGYPILRIKGLYFALVTFCFSQVVVLVISNWSFLGGAIGIFNIPHPNPVRFLGVTVDFLSKVPYYYLILVMVFIAMLVMTRLHVSRFGRIFTSIAENDSLAESIGINVTRHKVLAFAIGCFFAGLGGSIYAHYFSYLDPGMFGVWKSIELVLAVVIGGVISPVGPVIGAAFLTVLSEILRGTEEFGPLLLAIVLFVVVFTLPRGLSSLPEQVRAWIVQFSKKRSEHHGIT